MVALALSLSASGETGGTFSQRFERFQLLANCEPMDLHLSGLSDSDAKAIGLTKQSVQAAAESRLRAARLYLEDASYALDINVTLTDRAFGIDVGYNKFVYDPISGEAFLSRTWRTGSTGTHGGDSNYILSAISGHLDQS